MRLNPVYVRLANGDKIVCGYKIALTKSKVEQSGFKGNEDVDITYQKNKIIIKKKPTV